MIQSIECQIFLSCRHSWDPWEYKILPGFRDRRLQWKPRLQVSQVERPINHSFNAVTKCCARPPGPPGGESGNCCLLAIFVFLTYFTSDSVSAAKKNRFVERFCYFVWSISSQYFGSTSRYSYWPEKWMKMKKMSFKEKIIKSSSSSSFVTCLKSLTKAVTVNIFRVNWRGQ